ncbi:WXG100 family type VII secretion target [Nocardia sp. NPDC057663]|uniref:WXG100 family type VII secretion target n=1 Tax=Nocardia sp. NPDC057663 TaxID=3346201 RepID=UPI003670AEF7
MGFSASPAEIESFSTRMKDKHDTIEAMIRNSEGHATNVNNPAFQGAAGEAFQKAMTSYLESARALNNQLYNSSDNVSKIAKTITDEEVDNAQQIIAESADTPTPTLNMNS